jgi:hypothetical protein
MTITAKTAAMFVMPLFIITAPLCRADTDIDSLLSLDLAYSVTGFMHQGWGFGLGYERKIFDYVSAKGTFGHMTFLTGIEDVRCTSVNISLFINYYPFGNGLDKLYIGLGSGCDFMNYFGGGEASPATNDALIHITPRIGWKLNIKKYAMIDLSAGYKFIVVDADNYQEVKRYTNAGPQFGLGFKIFFKSLRKEQELI